MVLFSNTQICVYYVLLTCSWNVLSFRKYVITQVLRALEIREYPVWVGNEVFLARNPQTRTEHAHLAGAILASLSLSLDNNLSLFCMQSSGNATRTRKSSKTWPNLLKVAKQATLTVDGIWIVIIAAGSPSFKWPSNAGGRMIWQLQPSAESGLSGYQYTLLPAGVSHSLRPASPNCLSINSFLATSCQMTWTLRT